jgi:hypothetical protein
MSVPCLNRSVPGLIRSVPVGALYDWMSVEPKAQFEFVKEALYLVWAHEGPLRSMCVLCTGVFVRLKANQG